MVEKDSSLFTGAVATSLALVLSVAEPTITHAYISPSSDVVAQYGTSMVVDEDAQAKFMREREQMAQTYDADTEGTYSSAEQTESKKATYTIAVGGLIAVAFLAPMLQFFYYTGGD